MDKVIEKPPVLSDDPQVKRDLNKILSDFGNAYENLPDDLNDINATKLNSILQTAIDKIISKFEAQRDDTYRKTIEEESDIEL